MRPLHPRKHRTPSPGHVAVTLRVTSAPPVNVESCARLHYSSGARHAERRVAGALRNAEAPGTAGVSVGGFLRSAPATRPAAHPLINSSTHQPAGPRRRGTSLTEVLAAVLIMGVGVLAVMTLFPISILRSIQATQLTNATILSKRASEITDMFRLVTDDYIPQPQEGYETHCVIDPLGWHDMFTVDNRPDGMAHQYGNDGTDPVQYPPPIVLNDLDPPRFVRIDGTDLLLGNVVNGPPNAGVPLRRLGFAGNPFGDLLGTLGPAGPYPPLPAGGLFGLPPSVAARDAVLAAVGLPDNFDTVFVAEPDAPQTTATKVGFPAASFDLSDLASAVVPGTRVTLFDVTGRRSQVRTTEDGLALNLTGGNWEITWTDPLPANYVTISEVRVEYPEPRYSWMLTVRKTGTSGGSVTHIDCVVFFNRPTGDPSQEFVHQADQPDPNPGQPNSPPSDEVVLTFTAANKPRLKKGGWVFDPQHCRWYRILEINDETATTADLVLDRTADRRIRNLIVPEGVINVFPLRSRVDQKRLDAARL